MITKTKIAGLSLAAKLALGIGVAAASTSGAAALGVLPDIAGDDPVVTDSNPNAGVVFDDADDTDFTTTTVTAPSVDETTTTAEPVAEEPAPPIPDVEPAPAPAEEPPVTDEAATEPAPQPDIPATPEVPEEPEETGVDSLALECFQHESWSGVICDWDASSYDGVEYYLVINGTEERIWGDNPTSYVDVHADTVGETYTYSLVVKLDGDVVGSSSTVTINLVQWESDPHD